MFLHRETLEVSAADSQALFSRRAWKSGEQTSLCLMWPRKDISPLLPSVLTDTNSYITDKQKHVEKQNTE